MVLNFGRAVFSPANTLVFQDDGSIHADNTDGYGVRQNLHSGAPDWVPTDGPAVVFGAGGAARAVLQALLEAGVPQILLTNRTRGSPVACTAQNAASAMGISRVSEPE